MSESAPGPGHRKPLTSSDIEENEVYSEADSVSDADVVQLQVKLAMSVQSTDAQYLVFFRKRLHARVRDALSLRRNCRDYWLTLA